jgi:hypothetical protein
MNRLLPLAGDRSSEMPMKNQTENQPFKMITREVARILFGDENLSEMHLRLSIIMFPTLSGVCRRLTGKTVRRPNPPSVGVYK